MNEAHVTTQRLRDMVQDRVTVNWPEFAQAHPALAAAIEQVRLVQTVVEALRDDPELQKATQMAARDEAAMDAAGAAVRIIDAAVRRVLGCE